MKEFKIGHGYTDTSYRLEIAMKQLESTMDRYLESLRQLNETLIDFNESFKKLNETT